MTETNTLHFSENLSVLDMSLSMWEGANEKPVSWVQVFLEQLLQGDFGEYFS